MLFLIAGRPLIGPLYFLAFSAAGAFLVALGLLGVRRHVRVPTSGVVRLGLGAGSLFAALAAFSALLMLGLVAAWFTEPLFYPRTFRMDIIVAVIMVGLLATLAWLLLALVLVGAATWRAGLGRPIAGPFLVASGVLTLLPLAMLPPVGLVGTGPRWALPGAYVVWVVFFLAVGAVLRKDTGRGHRGDAVDVEGSERGR